MSDVTHDQLVHVAKDWLRNTCGCQFVGAEPQTWGPEIPDAFGWDRAVSFLVESKATRADFLADQRKAHRNGTETVYDPQRQAHTKYRPLGQYRYYLVPRGLVTEDEVPEGWGLLEYRPSKHKKGYYVKKVMDAPRHKREREDYREEVRVLVLMAVRFAGAVKTLSRFAWTEPEPCDGSEGGR